MGKGDERDFINLHITEYLKNQPLKPIGKLMLLGAAKSGEIDNVQSFIDSSIKIEEYTLGKALLNAASNKHTNVVKLLIEKGANINAQDEAGKTAFMIAAENGDIQTLELLIEKGANINAQDQEDEKLKAIATLMLLEAANSGKINNVKFFINSSIKIEKDTLEKALLNAASNKHTNVVELLIEKGANINAQDKEGKTALMIAKNSNIANGLITKYGADVNATDHNNKTPLMIAAEKGDIQTLKLLIAKGANINAQDNEGKTALMIAAEKGNIQTLKLLIAKGANINAQDNKGKTALMIAAEKDYLNIVQELVRQDGIDVNLKNSNCKTVLELAVKQSIKNAITKKLPENPKPIYNIRTNPIPDEMPQVIKLKTSSDNQYTVPINTNVQVDTGNKHNEMPQVITNPAVALEKSSDNQYTVPIKTNVQVDTGNKQENRISSKKDIDYFIGFMDEDENFAKVLSCVGAAFLVSMAISTPFLTESFNLCIGSSITLGAIGASILISSAVIHQMARKQQEKSINLN